MANLCKRGDKAKDAAMQKFMDALLTNFSAELQKDDKPKRVLLVLDVEVVAVAVSL